MSAVKIDPTPMTNTAAISTPPACPTARDAQRLALAGLIQLIRDCAESEAALERERRQQLEMADRELDRARLQAEHQLSTRGQEIRRKCDQLVAEALARHETETANCRESDRVKRRRVEGEYELAQREARKQLEAAVWLAESVADGTQAKVKSDTRKARELHDNERTALAELESAVEQVLQRYGYRPGPMEPLAASLDPKIPAAELYDLHKKSAENQLAALKALKLPKLLVGVAPWLLGFLLLVLTGGAGRVFLAGRLPEWQAMATGVGGGLGLLIALAIGMNVASRRAIRRTLAPFHQAIAAARAASARKLAETREKLDSMLQKALSQRDVEIRAARDKAEPTLARLKARHDEMLSSLDRELAGRLEHIDQRCAKAQAEAQSARDAALSELQRRIDADLTAARERHERKLQQIDQHYQSARIALIERWHNGLLAVQRGVGQPDGALQAPDAFTDDAIDRWQPPVEFPAAVRFGLLQVDAQQLLAHIPADAPFTLELPEKFALPAVLALPRQASLIIHADRAGRSAAIGALQMLMTRLLTSVPPGRVKFTIIDPVALGQNFAGFMHLADHDESLVSSRIWTDPEHIEQRLADLTEHMETVIQKYLRNEFETIDDYNRQAGELAEPYRFLVICDFPHGFHQDSLRRLASIASTGARCGVYVLMFRDIRQPIPPGSAFEDVEAHCVNLVQKDDRFEWRDEVFRQFPLTLDAPPAEEQLTRLMHKVGRLAREANRVEVPFEAIAPKPSEFWSLSARSELRVPIGRAGATRQQNLRLGRGVAQHALVAGKTGSGKSTLLHAIITNIAMWYPPQEVELYLIDFKKGVEFKTYAVNGLPHARAIAVESDREFGLSVLQRIDAEMTRRGELFRKLGVQDLAAWREAARSQALPGQLNDGEQECPGAAASGEGWLGGERWLPRVLLIIDEFQEFFSEDDKLSQEAALLIDRLVRQGRAFGIHVLLGSQTIGGSSGLARSTIGQMAVRVALQCSEADSQLILGDNNSAARLLTRPGEAIYNDAGGLVEGNSPFQVAWLPDEQRDRYLQQVRARCESAAVNHRGEAIVFEGNAPADIRKNLPLARLLRGDAVPAIPVAYLGEPVAIKAPTAIAFRRQAGAHVLMVGQSEEQAMAMMTSSLLSLSACLRGRPAQFIVLDGTPADSPNFGRLAAMAQFLAHPLRVVEYRATPDAIGELASELKRRQDAENADAAHIFLLIQGIQRYRVLRKTEESFSFGGEEKPPAADKLFNEILREGPALGIHVIAWADTAVSVDRTIERNTLREFDNRVLMQMSAADSSALIDSPAANKLGFYRAIAYSEEQGTIEKFRPYAIPPENWLREAGLTPGRAVS
ncbi:MAG: FtsK/SpoIIIE domain-containing protein [Phycisphaerae bacterium]|nr:FtsK/SpoIIIE domain-containing protein [Phycisphaerae bacterium]MDW8261697.1 FtsK/SpoIIIE domain-containing protein [Phycisphaerales bacterium]